MDVDNDFLKRGTQKYPVYYYYNYNNVLHAVSKLYTFHGSFNGLLYKHEARIIR